MKLKYYEAGMDLNLSKDFVESFRLFQGRILEEYDKIVDEFGLKVVDATKNIQKQQMEVGQESLCTQQNMQRCKLLPPECR